MAALQGRWKVWSDLLIGKQNNPMMKRLRIVQTPLFGVYVHFMYREDLDADPHDHPWAFWRMVLRGDYQEVYWDNPTHIKQCRTRIHRPWRLNKFPLEHAHRITSVMDKTVTIVFVGPKVKEWGFWVPDLETFYATAKRSRRWVAWTEYLKEATPGREAAPRGATR